LAARWQTTPKSTKQEIFHGCFNGISYTSRLNLRIRGPKQKLNKFLHDLDHHKGNGFLSLLYQE
jgi:hypothetical protein